jgi:hypothetical protein
VRLDDFNGCLIEAGLTHAPDDRPYIEGLFGTSASSPSSLLWPMRGESDIFITPGFEFRVLNRRLTNFHLTRSTLLMRVSALAGHEHMRVLCRRCFGQDDCMLADRCRPEF